MLSMNKYLFLSLLIFVMTSSLQAQHFFFSDRGLKNINLGESIYQIEKIYPFETVKGNLSIRNKYSFEFTDTIDYYYFKSVAIPTLFDSSTKIEDVFIATNKRDQIIGIIIFSSLINEDIIFRNLDSVYGSQKLILNSGIGDLRRQKNFWANEYSSVFLTISNSSNLLKTVILLKNEFQKVIRPDIFER
jgi:hypothetical protein